MDVTMIRRICSPAAAALALAVGLAGPAAAQAGTEDPPEPSTDSAHGMRDAETVAVDSVRAAVHAFHEALAAGDSSRALELLHPEVRVFEGGHPETLSEYRSGHLAADMDFSGSVDREVLDEQVSGGGAEGWALYLSEYRMAGTFRGEAVETRGTETMVLLRTADGWRIRHIHWSSR